MAQQRTIKRSDLSFCGFDDWCRAVYKDKNGIYYKDVTLKGNEHFIPSVLNRAVNNMFDDEPDIAYNVID